MAKQCQHIITITAKDVLVPFPIDMLRYDRCYPYTKDDSRKISEDMRTIDETGNLESITVSRADSEIWKPATERWKMYGWDVVKHEIRGGDGINHGIGPALKDQAKTEKVKFEEIEY